MKRDSFFHGLAAIAVAVTLASAQKPDTRWYTANPAAKIFTVATANELAGLAVIVNGMWDGTPTRDNFSGKTVTLAGNIDLSPYQNWDPIGDYAVNKSNMFSGKFDGGGYTISNLTVNRPNADYQGLFGVISGGAVGNLGVDKIIVSGRTSVGGLAGTVTNSGAIVKCNSNGAVSGVSKTNTDSGGVGGVVGSVSEKGRVVNSYFAGTAGGTGRNIGGVAGYVGYNALVSSCYSTGAISGEDNVGGVAGEVRGEVACCYSSAAVNGTGSRTGGVAGKISGTVRWSYSTGAVSGRYEVGGVSGSVGLGFVGSCYSTGAVNGKSSVGGVAGAVDGRGGFNAGNGKVYNCYSTGAVSGEDNVGGVVGRQAGEERFGEVSGCAALSSSVTGKTNVGRVVGGQSLRGALSNNVAYSEMTNGGGDAKWTDRGADAKDGEGISAAAVIVDGTIGWRFTSQNGWLVENGKLPGTGYYQKRDNVITFADWVKTINMPPHIYNDNAAELEAAAVRQKEIKAEAEREKQKKADAERAKQDEFIKLYANTVAAHVKNGWRRGLELETLRGKKKLSKKDMNRTLDIKFGFRSNLTLNNERCYYTGEVVKGSVSVVTSSGDKQFDGMSESVVSEMKFDMKFDKPLPAEALEMTFTFRLGPINK
jgi:hypothetical protein